MNSSTFRTMKLISSLALVVAIGAFLLSLASTHYALALYTVAFSASLVLVLATDYSSRARRWEPRSLRLAPATTAKTQRLQLAA